MTEADIETESRSIPDGGEHTRAVVSFEVPEEIVDEVRDEHGEIDRDALSDRIVPAPLVDGESV